MSKNKKQEKNMLKKVKEDLFTIPGILTTLIHVCFAVGLITSLILFQTEVMGIDPTRTIATIRNR